MFHIVCTLLLAGASLIAASAQAVSDSVGVLETSLDYGLHIVSYPAHSDEFTGRTTCSAASSASSPTRGTTWT